MPASSGTLAVDAVAGSVNCEVAWGGEIRSASGAVPTDIAVEEVRLSVFNMEMSISWFVQIRTFD